MSRPPTSDSDDPCDEPAHPTSDDLTLSTLFTQLATAVPLAPATDTDTAYPPTESPPDLTPADTTDFVDPVTPLTDADLSAEVTTQLTATPVAKDYILASLDAFILLTLARRGPSNGADIKKALAQSFDVTISPGTLYPRLHALTDAGYLTVTETIQAKEYRLAALPATAGYLQRIMYQHLKLACLFNEFLDAYHTAAADESYAPDQSSSDAATDSP